MSSRLVGSEGLRRNRSIPSAPVIPVLVYPDVREAVDWLTTAFGFSERVRIGEGHRSQLAAGEGAVILGDVRGERRPPRPGESNHSVMIRVEDVHGHCARARAAGARIIDEPQDFPYGERQYMAEDPWGHRVGLLRDAHGRGPDGVGRGADRSRGGADPA